ncbi:hypothetical protein SRB17_39540 [Streptomyces sp. RB17]|uniref:hypothetical protein n=1 Tax=Streptomyces sp. RB17 TaxID=2585197 RepID=UPI001296F26E|nr:hypothetical protein [Streptomyces sp. RB17]MQY35958.1 hypothetical protein [Streptomyces sp. RB17]
MGERLSGDGVQGRRRVRPGAVSGAPDTAEAAALETVLATVLRTGELDPRAERLAVAAFRDAHATGAHRARTRRRDDWRPAAQRRARRPVRLTFGAVFASLALGGVAVAAIGSAGSSTHGSGAGPKAGHPSAVASERPGGTASSAPFDGSRPAGRPASAQDTEAHCRAYEHVQGRGKALDATAWQRLVTAAGGKDKVAAYCSEQLARATATPSGPAGTGKSGDGASGGKTGTAGKGTSGDGSSSGTGTSGNGSSGKGTSGSSSGGTSGGTDNTSGSGKTGGGRSGGKH